ncbi:hypothetical protein [Allokutzneria oryzae]|uniref:Uncharacterized protein n=1 Tax=Allokutzneria oryzae TaxID=1378989 RepID=A0ABV6A6C8_9PSEU
MNRDDQVQLARTAHTYTELARRRDQLEVGQRFLLQRLGEDLLYLTGLDDIDQALAQAKRFKLELPAPRRKKTAASRTATPKRKATTTTKFKVSESTTSTWECRGCGGLMASTKSRDTAREKYYHRECQPVSCRGCQRTVPRWKMHVLRQCPWCSEPLRPEERLRSGRRVKILLAPRASNRTVSRRPTSQEVVELLRQDRQRHRIRNTPAATGKAGISAAARVTVVRGGLPSLGKRSH